MQTSREEIISGATIVQGPAGRKICRNLIREGITGIMPAQCAVHYQRSSLFNVVGEFGLQPAIKMTARIIQIASNAAILCAAAALLGGCAAAVPALGSAASAALQLAGIGKPDVPDSQKPPRDLGITLYAARNLNAATDNKPLALVVRLYALKDPTSFQQAPFDTFTDPAKEKSTLGADLLSVREITLIPGQRYNATEKVSREAQAFGIVALFRDPAMKRWKFAFDPAKSEKSGIMVGLHNCAMTVTSGTVIPADAAQPAQALNLLSSVTCG